MFLTFDEGEKMPIFIAQIIHMIVENVQHCYVKKS
jgi:hypothetical protein